MNAASDRVLKIVDDLRDAAIRTSGRNAAKLASALGQAVEALKSLVEIEKSQAEACKLRMEEKKAAYDLEHAAKQERSEVRQRYVTILTPIATTLILGLTLLSQTYQFAKSERDKEVAAEDGQWSAAVKTVSEAAKMSPIAIALNPFLKSKRYAETARRTAVQALVGTRDSLVFADLFRQAFVPVDWNNLDAVLQLDRALGPRLGNLYQKTFDPKTKTNNDGLLSPDEKEQLDYLTDALSTISVAITPLLQGGQPPGRKLDLRGTWFKDCDWSGVDLREADIEDLDLRYALLKGADLSGITSFSGVYLYHTPWWEAKRISPELLQYLLKNWPYQEGAYGPKNVAVSSQEYADAIARLKNK